MSDADTPRRAEPKPATAPSGERGDLSITALYTSQVWRWGRLSGAKLYDLGAARVVFLLTNAFLWVARLTRWSLPSLKHSLLHRHTAIDALFVRSGARRLLELACGLSRRGAALSSEASVDVVEVDLPAVIETKRALLTRTPEGEAVLARPNLHLVTADVTETPLAELAPPGPDLFITAEGLLMYLDAPAQRRLWARVASFMREGAETGESGTFVFDLVPTVEQPPPGIVGRALGWLMGRFTGGRTFERDERTRDDIAQELGDAGFSSVELVEPRAVAEAWGLPYPHKRTQQLLFVCRVASATPAWR